MEEKTLFDYKSIGKHAQTMRQKGHYIPEKSRKSPESGRP